METLAVLLQVVAVFLNGRDHALIGVGGGIVGNKTDVRADCFNAEQLSEVGDFARFLKPRLARLFRHESDRFRSTRDRFVRFAFKSQKDDGRRNSVFAQFFEERFRIFRSTRRLGGGVKLDRFDSKIANDF